MKRTPVAAVLVPLLLLLSACSGQRPTMPEFIDVARQVLRFAEVAGFETRDVESLREHYALTLRRWVRRLEGRHVEAARVAGEHAYRVWRLYMAGSARAFAMGRIGIIQALFSKSGEDGLSNLPLTRKDLYRPGIPALKPY
jgi:hypothetical protein